MRKCIGRSHRSENWRLTLAKETGAARYEYVAVLEETLNGCLFAVHHCRFVVVDRQFLFKIWHLCRFTQNVHDFGHYWSLLLALDTVPLFIRFNECLPADFALLKMVASAWPKKGKKNKNETSISVHRRFFLTVSFIIIDHKSVFPTVFSIDLLALSFARRLNRIRNSDISKFKRTNRQ